MGSWGVLPRHDIRPSSIRRRRFRAFAHHRLLVDICFCSVYYAVKYCENDRIESNGSKGARIADAGSGCRKPRIENAKGCEAGVRVT